MAAAAEDLFALWTWPLAAWRLGSDLIETSVSTGNVLAARLPMIAAAATNPAGADVAELGRMVTEKIGAFGRSGREAGSAGAAVRRASSANARALGRLAGGGILWPADWMRLADSNLALAATLAALPAAMLAPIHAGVTANDRRLRR